MLNIPKVMVAGDRVEWKDSNLDIAKTLTWAIRGATILDLTATVDGSEFVTAIAPNQSATLTEGEYYYQAFLTDINGDRQTIEAGQITVVVNLATASLPYDGRSTAKQMLDAVETAIKTILEGGAVQSYSIKGRNLAKMPMTELVTLRSQLKAEVARENAAATIATGLGDPKRMFVRFR